MDIKVNNIRKVGELYKYDSEITEVVNPFGCKFVIIESHVVGIGNNTYEYSVWSYSTIEEIDKYNYEVIDLEKLITKRT